MRQHLSIWQSMCPQCNYAVITDTYLEKELGNFHK